MFAFVIHIKKINLAAKSIKNLLTTIIGARSDMAFSEPAPKIQVNGYCESACGAVQVT